MIPPQNGWHAFENQEEVLDYLREHQLISEKAQEVKQIYYNGFYSSEIRPCHVVGYVDPTVSVILVDGQLHCIHPDLLKDMQPRRNIQLIFVPDYTVIDLETTGLSPTSDEIIELAAIRIRGGQIVDRFESLVQCKRCLPSIITEITGIQDLDLTDAPFIEDILPAFLSFLGNDLLVGHNIRFDADFLNHTCVQVLDRPMLNGLIDTLGLSKKLLDLKSYKLSAVRNALNLPVRTAHRALADCETTVDVYEALKHQEGPSKNPVKKPKTRYKAAPLERRPELYPTEIITGEASPFWGAACVLTGELHISREEAVEMIKTAGGIVRTSVSKKTNYLIVGQQDKALVGDDGLSSKEEKAIAINESGTGHIEMITEAQFCAMLSKEGAPCG